MDLNRKLAKSFESFEPIHKAFLQGSNFHFHSLPNILLERSHSHHYDNSSEELLEALTESVPRNKEKNKIFKKTWDKVKTAITHSHPHQSHQSHGHGPPSKKKGSITPETFDCQYPQKSAFNYEEDLIHKNYLQLQQRLSEEFQQMRMSKIKPVPVESLSEDFKKRLRQWEMWKVSTGKVTYTDEELEKILPEDFSKKLHEWEVKMKMKSSKATAEAEQRDRDTTNSPEVNRKFIPRKKKGKKRDAFDKIPSELASSSKEEQLVWLEKELEKVEIEKRKLEREIERLNEKGKKLEKVKLALVSNYPDCSNFYCELMNECEEKVFFEEGDYKEVEKTPGFLMAGPSCFREEKSGQESNEEDYHKLKKQRTPSAETITSSSSADFEGTHGQSAIDCHHFPQKAASSSRASSTNTDSYYEFRPSSRRHSSIEATTSNTNNTPLSARSPSLLSAFTSDDDEEEDNEEFECSGMFKTITEENETFGNPGTNSNGSTLKDAESQTEAATMKAKKAVMISADPSFEDGEENETNLGNEDTSGIFVPTKRTIFKTILDDDGESEDEFCEEEKVLLNKCEESEEEEDIPAVIGSPIPSPFLSDLLPLYSSSSNSFSFKKGLSPSRGGGSANVSPSFSRQPPRIVEVTPKKVSPVIPIPIPAASSSHSQQSSPRAIPKMGKIPVWCSPWMMRKHQGQIKDGKGEVSSSFSGDFSRTFTEPAFSSTGQRPVLPVLRHSKSFRSQKQERESTLVPSVRGNPSSQVEPGPSSRASQSRVNTTSNSVSKSQSTGSIIRSKLGKAFSSFLPHSSSSKRSQSQSRRGEEGNDGRTSSHQEGG